MDTLLRPRHRLAFLIASCHAACALAAPSDHREFEATLYAPYKAESAAGARERRTFTLNFEYPGLERAQAVTWQLELVAPSGSVVRRWQGSTSVLRDPVSVAVRWTVDKD